MKENLNANFGIMKRKQLQWAWKKASEKMAGIQLRQGAKPY